MGTTRLQATGYLFSALAFGMFVYSAFVGPVDPWQAQALYWFLAALASAILPSVQRVKFKDLELELKKDLGRVEAKVDQLRDAFAQASEIAWDEEEPFDSADVRLRNAHWDRFQSYVDSLDDSTRFDVQRLNSLDYLKSYGLTVTQLKEKLLELGFYGGSLDDRFTVELAKALTAFQAAFNLRHTDGVFGPLTYQRMLDVIANHPKITPPKLTDRSPSIPASGSSTEQ